MFPLNGEKILQKAFLSSGKIEKSSGFTAEETTQLSNYLQQNAEDIMKKAEKVNPLRNWMGKD